MRGNRGDGSGVFPARSVRRPLPLRGGIAGGNAGQVMAAGGGDWRMCIKRVTAVLIVTGLGVAARDRPGGRARLMPVDSPVRALNGTHPEMRPSAPFTILSYSARGIPGNKEVPS